MASYRYRERCIDEKGHECVACGDTEKIVVHHRDADRSNDAIENLVPLCHGCHSVLHSAEDVPERLEELRSELPDYSITYKEGEGKTSKSIHVDGETKELFKEKQPRGITQGLFLKRLLERSPPADRIFVPDNPDAVPCCPACETRGEDVKGYYSGVVCTTEKCDVTVYDGDLPEPQRDDPRLPGGGQ